ncbi:hypothetical protein BCV70DRAFT_229440 [Testicularia cyperi]|uniref:Uncharacterized protein n=1 Tax=Testicularia cyperi TaxID=1882483 RepID=A0A317XYW4_9BASI|nr:hypothetical protein BCV70DRAFT_229440 [Testicularia cyperi]
MRSWIFVPPSCLPLFLPFFASGRRDAKQARCREHYQARLGEMQKNGRQLSDDDCSPAPKSFRLRNCYAFFLYFAHTIPSCAMGWFCVQRSSLGPVDNFDDTGSEQPEFDSRNSENTGSLVVASAGEASIPVLPAASARVCACRTQPNCSPKAKEKLSHLEAVASPLHREKVPLLQARCTVARRFAWVRTAKVHHFGRRSSLVARE